MSESLHCRQRVMFIHCHTSCVMSIYSIPSQEFERWETAVRRWMEAEATLVSLEKNSSEYLIGHSNKDEPPVSRLWPYEVNLLKGAKIVAVIKNDQFLWAVPPAEIEVPGHTLVEAKWPPQKSQEWPAAYIRQWASQMNQTEEFVGKISINGYVRPPTPLPPHVVPIPVTRADGSEGFHVSVTDANGTPLTKEMLAEKGITILLL